MRINMILNEKEYVEKIIRKGKTREDNLMEVLKLMGMYYAQECNYSKKQIKEEFKEFYRKTYNKEPDHDMLKIFERYIKRADQRDLLQVDYIPIYPDEMETIKSLDNKITQRFLLTMICLARYHNYLKGTDFNYTNTDVYELAKLAQVPGNKDNKIEHFKILYKSGLVFLANSGNVRVDCMTSDETQEPVLKINRIKDIANQYKLYCGESYKPCEECGLLFRTIKDSKQPLCPKCRKAKSMEVRTFLCIDCKTEFTSDCRGNLPKRCPICQNEYIRQKKAEAYEPVEAKICVCEDCGKEFESHSRGKTSTKCPECYKIYRREYFRLAKQKERENKNVNS